MEWSFVPIARIRPSSEMAERITPERDSKVPRACGASSPRVPDRDHEVPAQTRKVAREELVPWQEWPSDHCITGRA